ncbi:patatin [Scytonema hofmannii PCC 7110]|uniref:Patatin n=1 Tax=Scytonema hofmannii PCC 7110 TaxID=128403 RepID=A0A139XDH9_9CYAN|nr:patatin-like phospholipase family protein [Scytonema hofmannii]KYC42754.1 patatin [Scytonema hofmannii PCC 7110]
MTNKVYTQSVLTFDGQDDYIDFGKNDIGGVFAEGSSAFTISGWLNPHQLTSKASTYGTRNVFFARSSDRYSDNFEFGISESGNLDVYIDEKLDNGLRTFGNGELTLGQWHFFAIVFYQGQLTIYLDEHEYAGSLRGASLNKATSSVTLGATLHNNIYYTGQIANISVWNYPCDQTQIQTQRYQPLVGNELGLVAYWTLNEGEGAIVRDQTGNGYGGTLHGNPTWDLAELPYMTAQSSNEGERQDETANRLEENLPLTETVVQEEDSPTQETTALAPAAARNEGQPKVKKETRKKLARDQTSLTSQPQAGEIKIDQTSQSEVSENIPQQERSQTFTQEQSQAAMNTPANAKYKILTIDGGGIRGIIPALILAEIEKRTQKQIFSLFDLIAGTSTGGVLALGLTKPRLNLEPFDTTPIAQYTAEDLVKLFVEYGPEMFYEPAWEKILGPIEDVFIQPKYAADSREEIFREYFGDAPLEGNLKEVFVTSYDIEQRIPILFTNKVEKQQIESKRFRKLSVGFTLKDAAMATTAIPTYFPPYRVASSHNANGFYTLVDGGLIANNPTYLAIMEARISRQNTQPVNLDDLLIVSLGTGSLTSVYTYNEVKHWGQLQWGQPLLNIVFDGGSEVVAGELERWFEASQKELNGSYYRFQTFLTGDLELVDNVKLENIRQLQASAHQLIAAQSQQIDELCNILLS